MNIEKIKINGHYIWVDADAPINPPCFVAELPFPGSYDVFQIDTLNDVDAKTQKRIIAADEELGIKGVPSYVEWLANETYPETYYSGIYVDNWLKAGFIKGYQTAEKELQKKLIIEIMNEDAKDGLYDEYEQISQDNPVTRGSTALVKKSQTEEEQRPTWDDVRKAIKITSATILNHLQSKTDLLHIEEIIEQLKQIKK